MITGDTMVDNEMCDDKVCDDEVCDDEVCADQDEGSCQEPSCKCHCRATVPLVGAGEPSRTSGTSGMQHLAWYCPQLTLQVQTCL